jgi:hypothetical protein
MNKNIMRELGFEDWVTETEKGNCPACNKLVEERHFKDDLSRKEFAISGLCQFCQDFFFDPETEE